MAKNAHYLRRREELRFLRNQQGLLERRVNGFIRASKYALKNREAIELSPDKMKEVMWDLQQLERFALQYKEWNKRMSRVKVRQWEYPILHGPVSDIVGIRRQINRKLENLLNRIRLMRTNLSNFKFSDQAVAFEQTAKQIDNFTYRDDQGNLNLQPGASFAMAVTFLLVFFIEVVKKRE